MLIGLLFFLIPAAVFAATVGALRLGHRIAARRAARDEASRPEGVRTIEAALFALFGLLIAFSFSGAQSRLDARRARSSRRRTRSGPPTCAWICCPSPSVRR